jgi:peptidyl-prolyl cis-trans isomerase SurA
MKKKIIIILFFLIFNQAQSIETKIIHKIQDEIITNIDIKYEYKYLLALNRSLNELDKEKILSIANESIIKEKIKKIEVAKNFKEIKLSEDYSDLLVKNIYSRLDLKSINEFEVFLKNYDLTINNIKRKIAIDALWNELIIKKYSPQISINEAKIKKEILKNSKIQSKEYQLSEIIFEVTNKKEVEKKYKQLKSGRIYKTYNSIKWYIGIKVNQYKKFRN